MALSKILPASQEVQAVGKNLIINGAMQVAQRGTSQTASSYGSLDRFLYNLSGGAGTMSQQTLALGSEQRGSKHFLRIACSTGNDNHGFLHRIEDVRSVSTGIHTLSFDAKGTNPNGGTFTIKINQSFGSGGSPSADATLALQTFTVTSSFQTFDFQFDIPSVSGKTLGSNNDDYLQILISQGADTSTDAWTLDITNIQFELGSTATPFEHRSYGDELARCHRYCYSRFLGLGSLSGDATYGYTATNSSQYGAGSIVHIDYPRPMLKKPTLTYTQAGGAVSSDRSNSYKAQLFDEDDAGFIVYDFLAEAEL